MIYYLKCALLGIILAIVAIIATELWCYGNPIPNTDNILITGTFEGDPVSVLAQAVTKGTLILKDRGFETVVLLGFSFDMINHSFLVAMKGIHEKECKNDNTNVPKLPG